MYRKGMTLVEIMVAVAIMILMMVMIGYVFKSAISASGSAMALNDISRQTRTFTRWLNKDFSGLQADMPFVIVFEGHTNNNKPGWGDPDEPEKLIRYDRVCFFANGNFQDISNSALSGNVARIYYGQFANTPPLNIDSDTSAPRQILSRRFKILTGNEYYPKPLTWGPTNEQYDFLAFENASMSKWKYGYTANEYISNFFNDLAIVSFVRRPDYDNLAANAEMLQKLYFLSDITDFKIQLYLKDASCFPPRWRWFPDDCDMQNLSDKFAFYWNVPDINGPHNPPMDIAGIKWWHELEIDPGVFETNWPKAIRFTFTIYDKGRQRFPNGKTFSYIIKSLARH